MAKRKCKHGKTKAGPCRKGPKKHKARKAAHSKPKASLSVAKRISTVGRKRCGNPDRQGEIMKIAKYISEVGRVEREYGPGVRPISQVKRNIRALQKTALKLVRVGRKCARANTEYGPKRLMRDN